MIKILFFIPGLSEGGAEKVLCNLVNHMDQSKFDITVQTIDTFDRNKYLKKGIRYRSINRCKTRLGKKLFSYYFRACAELKKAYDLFIKDDYDIEVAYLETGATKLIAQSTNKRAVKYAWVHCDLSKKAGMDVNIEKVKAQYQQFNEIICVSKDAECGFHKLYGEELKTRILHNVIDDEEIRRKASIDDNPLEGIDCTKLIAIGRLTDQKDFSHLIRTAAKLKKAGHSFCLNILGEGPEKDKLTNLISELHVADCVFLRGFISNPYIWMTHSDFVVCSSKYEGISSVVQEAFFLGKPVVTTPCTGMDELLGDSEYGLIVDDSENGLFEGIEKLLQNESLREKYAALSKKRSEAFSKKNIIRETEDLFLDSLKQ